MINIDELKTFPVGKHDDQVDGASGAFNKLYAPSGTGSLLRRRR